MQILEPIEIIEICGQTVAFFLLGMSLWLLIIMAVYGPENTSPLRVTKEKAWQHHRSNYHFSGCKPTRGGEGNRLDNTTLSRRLP